MAKSSFKVIVERAEESDVPEIDMKRYLVPADMSAGQFVLVVRKRIKLSPENDISIFVRNIPQPNAAMMISAIDRENEDEDGFPLHDQLWDNTFGTF
ncbi:hypothetical protein FNV43_RR13362 [Rhamnella rubrinervis]|uniref:Autophagy-related protein n=1 Tax=Rhamnella rubrinervis TaxID=2594499 RepID=A0A8K0H0W9_9ROSA|nr:hypothetical protein FNV43_RR13362 [Rhamnella rubrinervis]